MKYPSEISSKCKKIILESSKYNVTKHNTAKELKNLIYTLTSSFPANISYSKRISAVASQNTCECIVCGKIHGDVAKEKYCSKKCYLTDRKDNALSKEEYQLRYTITQGNKKYANSVEGYDYLICKICNARSGDLGSHVHMHNITPAEYKRKYNIQKLKPIKNIDNRKGKNNPAYNHNGKYSAWSKNFIHGYDEARHIEAKKQHSNFVKNNRELNVFMFEYWLQQANGNEALASDLYIKSQTKNLEWFIDKYGDVDGPRRHKAKTEKWMKSMNSKSQEEKDRINSLKAASIGNRSNAEKEIEIALLETGLEVTSQYLIKRPEGSWFSYDIQYNNKIIEYNGDYWHCNPNKYSAEYINSRLQKSAKEVWAKDELKRMLAIQNGFDILTIWEHDYNNSKEEVIQECLKFLTQ